MAIVYRKCAVNGPRGSGRADGHIPSNFMKFLISHKVVHEEVCSEHRASGTPGKTNPMLNICWKRKGNNKCRKRLSRLSPYFSSKQKRAKEKFLFWIKICQKVDAQASASQLCVNRNTITEWKRELLRWVWKSSKVQNETVLFSRCAVDETFFFKRKYNTGRSQSFWTRSQSF